MARRPEIWLQVLWGHEREAGSSGHGHFRVWAPSSNQSYSQVPWKQCPARGPDRKPILRASVSPPPPLSFTAFVLTSAGLAQMPHPATYSVALSHSSLLSLSFSDRTQLSPQGANTKFIPEPNK